MFILTTMVNYVPHRAGRHVCGNTRHTLPLKPLQAQGVQQLARIKRGNTFQHHHHFDIDVYITNQQTPTIYPEKGRSKGYIVNPLGRRSHAKANETQVSGADKQIRRDHGAGRASMQDSVEVKRVPKRHALQRVPKGTDLTG